MTVTVGQRNLEEITEFVAAGLGQGIGLPEVAAFAGLSPTYFSSRFVVMTGKTFSRWLRRHRVQTAQKRLLKGSRVIDSALDVGYQSERSLQRAFKEETGLTPLEWLRRHGPDGAPPD